MTDEQYIDIAIEISKNAKYPYGAIVLLYAIQFEL